MSPATLSPKAQWPDYLHFQLSVFLFFHHYYIDMQYQSQGKRGLFMRGSEGLASLESVESLESLESEEGLESSKKTAAEAWGRVASSADFCNNDFIVSAIQ